MLQILHPSLDNWVYELPVTTYGGTLVGPNCDLTGRTRHSLLLKICAITGKMLLLLLLLPPNLSNSSLQGLNPCSNMVPPSKKIAVVRPFF